MSTAFKILSDDVETRQKVVREKEALLEKKDAHIAVLEELIRSQSAVWV